MINQWEPFANAPIVEAIVDVRIEPEVGARGDYSADDFEELRNDLPTVEPQLTYVFQSPLLTDKPPLQQFKPMGLRFRSEHEVLQIRVDGFTFSMLKPYTNWDDLITRAKKYWRLYAEKRGTASIVRLGLRYINLMHFPLDVPLTKFLLSPPQLPETLGRPLRRFFSAFEIDQDNDTHANIIQTVQPVTADKLPFVLDIDAYRVGAYAMDDARLWETFDALHRFKNEIFFNSITEEAKELWR